MESGFDCLYLPGEVPESVCFTWCGDGLLAVGEEECDDGNTDDGDGCDAMCQVESGWDCVFFPGYDPESICETTCGDGLLAVGEEECDDGNTGAGDGCNALCEVEEGWTCDGEPSTPSS